MGAHNDEIVNSNYDFFMFGKLVNFDTLCEPFVEMFYRIRNAKRRKLPSRELITGPSVLDIPDICTEQNDDEEISSGSSTCHQEKEQVEGCSSFAGNLASYFILKSQAQGKYNSF